jgi:hypothetical protein
MAAPSRIAAALDYLGRLKAQADQANAQTQLQTANVARDFAGGVGQNLANRARDLGQLGYEAFTSAPATPQTTAEFAESASQRQPTPTLDATAQGLGQIGKALVTDPVGAGKAIIGGEINRARSAASSPAAAGEYAGGFIDPMRIAKALRRAAPIFELDAYHGTPHRFPATEANELGEFDASKIGTGEGAQAYGHGLYLAENPNVAGEYQKIISADGFLVGDKVFDPSILQHLNVKVLARKGDVDAAIAKAQEIVNSNSPATKMAANDLEKLQAIKAAGGMNPNKGSLYTVDLPDEHIERMLDWDKPLSEQSDTVKNALRENGVTAYVDEMEASYLDKLPPKAKELAQKMIHGPDEMVISYGKGIKNNDIATNNWVKLEKLAPGIDHNEIHNIRDWYESKNGANLYTEFSQGVDKSANVASERLRQMGIPGIKYLDAGSRDAKKGTRNFVVFPGEEKHLKILKRK